MKNVRLLIIGAIGAFLIARHFAGTGVFFSANARCLNCRRDFYAGSETNVVCLGCRHVLPASLAKRYFNTPQGFPFAAPLTQQVRGKLPNNTIER